MVKTPPERLAAALRANLKRRKAAPDPKALEDAAKAVPAGDSPDLSAAKPGEKPLKSQG